MNAKNNKPRNRNNPKNKQGDVPPPEFPPAGEAAARKQGEKRKNTPKQTVASQENGAKGRGPMSPEGKDAAKLNAVKDAIFSTEIVVESAGEDLEDFERLQNDLWNYLSPKDPVQEMLAIDVIEDRWRLQRVRRAERLALKARVEISWIEEELRRSEELDRLNSEFLRKSAEYLALSKGQFSAETFKMEPQLEEIRIKLAATSRGLEFLIEVMEEIEKKASSKPYLSWEEMIIILACCGFDNDLARQCEDLNLLNIKVAMDEQKEAIKTQQAESPGEKKQNNEDGDANIKVATDEQKEARKKQKSKSEKEETQNSEKEKPVKTEAEKLKELTLELLRSSEAKKSDQEKSKGRDFVAEISDAPNVQAWMLAQAVKEATRSLRIRLQLVKAQEEMEKQARINDAIVPVAGADRFLRAETAFERRMYRALGLLFAIQSGAVEVPQLPPSLTSIRGRKT